MLRCACEAVRYQEWLDVMCQQRMQHDTSMRSCQQGRAVSSVGIKTYLVEEVHGDTDALRGKLKRHKRAVLEQLGTAQLVL